jgi:hypothetical protein
MRPAVVSVSRAAVAAATLAVVAGLLGAVSTPASGRDAGAKSHAKTHRVVVRPVDSAGNAVPGWTVKREKGVTVQCDGPAPAAVDDGIGICFPTAEYLPACWKSHHHTVLCLRDARTMELVRLRFSGRFGSPIAPKRPSPQDLVLAHGQPCSIRVGGAWGTLPTHPNWLGYYSCAHGSVYGPARGDGVNRSAQPWQVRIWKSGTKHRVVRRSVATAYFVGTHA